MRLFRPLWLACSGVLLLAGCGEDPPAGQAPAATAAVARISSNPGPLSYAPVETPYVIGNLELPSDAVMAAWWAKTEPLLALYGPFLDQVLADPKLPAKEHPLAVAFVGEFAKLRKRADFEALGLGGKARMALYGIGLLPVMRLELPDAAPLKALVQRVEEKAGSKIPVARLGELEYYSGTAGPFEIAVALPPGQLVATVWPATAPESVKQALLASAPPSDNIETSGKLQQLNAKYGYLGLGSGYVDVQKVAAAVMSPSGEADRALFQALEAKPPELSEACRRDFAHLASRAPLLAFGMTRFDANGMDHNTVFELESTLAQELAGIAAPIPAVAAQAKWAGFGLGVNGPALAKFIDARAKALAAAPYECADLANLDDELGKMAQQLSGATVFLGMAKGIALSLDALQLDPATQKPSAIDLSLLIASDTPQALYGMAATTLPPIAELQLEPNGTPRAIPLDQVPEEMRSLGTAWAVMTDKALVVRFGPEDQGARAKALTATPLAAPGTVLTYAFSGELYRMMGTAMAAAPDESTPPAVREQMQQMMNTYANLIRHVSVDVLLTSRGVEMVQKMQIGP